MTAVEEWTDDELRAAVGVYLEILEDELADRPINKTARRDQLLSGELNRRTASSIEYRLQNISHVLETMGRPRIAGYAPAANVGSGVKNRIEGIIRELSKVQGAIRLREVVPNIDLLMGVKAVFGPISSHVLCFGGRGEVENTKQYYSVPAGAASRASTQPYVITIGGGRNVRDGYEGRVLNVARLSRVYGPTRLLIPDPDEVERLAQWPVAIALHDVWRFVDQPRIVDDLGMPDRTILAGAQDGIIRPLEKLERLWDVLEGQTVELAKLPPPANFYESDQPTLVGNVLPGLPSRMWGEEGKRIWNLQSKTERDPRLSRDAKRLNFAKYGVCTCEACYFKHSDQAMFDAHHPTPLAIGSRTTFAEHLEVLCPTCHRRAHRSKDRLRPFTLQELK